MTATLLLFNSPSRNALRAYSTGPPFAAARKTPCISLNARWDNRLMY
jgi:hypothetical protein